jgi:glyoxylase I family protein
MAYLEHVNFTVSDPAATAEQLVTWFGWKIRWHGPSKNGGTTFHVGNETSYIAVYTPPEKPDKPSEDNYTHLAGLNHVAIVVDDLDATEQKIIASGIKTHSHADYEPGRRFYFHDPDGIEFEIVSYATT